MRETPTLSLPFSPDVPVLGEDYLRPAQVADGRNTLRVGAEAEVHLEEDDLSSMSGYNLTKHREHGTYTQAVHVRLAMVSRAPALRRHLRRDVKVCPDV